MAGEGKIDIEIVYCVSSSYHAAVVAFIQVDPIIRTAVRLK